MDRLLTVSGRGHSSAEPDTIRIRGDLEGVRSTYGAAVEAAANAVEYVKKSVEDAGFDPDIVRTSNLSVYSKYRRIDGRNEFDGYEYTHSIKITIPRDAEKLDLLLSALVSSRNSPEFSISYRLSDQTECLNQARRNAIEDARQKAEVLAEAAGVRLGQIVSISYGTESGYSGGGRIMMLGASGGMGSSISPEDVEFSQEVIVQWEII